MFLWPCPISHTPRRVTTQRGQMPRFWFRCGLQCIWRQQDNDLVNGYFNIDLLENGCHNSYMEYHNENKLAYLYVFLCIKHITCTFFYTITNFYDK